MNKRNYGFTLVELLVVMGIIAVLVSILLPALGRVRSMAQITKCAAQMRDIGNAARMYANDNRDSLPPYHWDTGAANFDLWGSNGSGVGYLWVFRNTSDFMSVNEEGNGLGRLMKTGYLKLNGTSFLDFVQKVSCPNTKWDDPTATYNSVYYFNPHVASRTVGGTTVHQLWFKKLTKLANFHGGTFNCEIQTSPWTGTVTLPTFRRALMSDPMYSFGTASHAYGNKRAWNMLFADGSVKTASVDANAQRYSTGNAKFQWLLDQYNYLADVADGGGLRNSTGGVDWNHYYNAIPINPTY